MRTQCIRTMNTHSHAHTWNTLSYVYHDWLITHIFCRSFSFEGTDLGDFSHAITRVLYVCMCACIVCAFVCVLYVHTADL